MPSKGVVSEHEFWIQTFYVIGAGHGLISMFTITVVNIVRGIYTGIIDFNNVNGCVLAWRNMRGMVIIAYLYLALYGYMLLGPIPFRKTLSKPKMLHGLVAIVSIIAYVIFTIQSLNTCDEHLLLQAVLTLQLACFWIAVLANIGRVIKRALSKKEHNRWKKLEDEAVAGSEVSDGVASQDKKSNLDKEDEGEGNDDKDGDENEAEGVENDAVDNDEISDDDAVEDGDADTSKPLAPDKPLSDSEEKKETGS